MNSRDSFNRALEWLLDLEHIRLGRDAPLSLFWQTDLPAWFLAPLAALAVILIVWQYRRENCSRGARVVLVMLRLALLGVVLLALCEPVLRLQRERIEPSYVTLLMDTSASMGITDLYGDAQTAATLSEAAGLNDGQSVEEATRFDLARGALLNHQGQVLRAMLARNRVELHSFGMGGRVEAVAESVNDWPVIAVALESMECTGVGTRMREALGRVLSRVDRGRLSAIVLVSDGRNTGPDPLNEAIVKSRARGVPIHTVLVGSADMRPDVRVEAVALREQVYLKDSAVVRVRVSVGGNVEILDSGPRRNDGLEPIRVDLELKRDHDGQVLARQAIHVDPGEEFQETDLPFKPSGKGWQRYRIEATRLPGERDTADNVEHVRIFVIDDALRVLYVEGYPRFEYRFLVNALVREPTIRSSCLLLSADARFSQEGDEPIQRFPQDLDELAAYDVVLLGDVQPDDNWLNHEQQQLLVEFVGEKGGGLGLLAGSRFGIEQFAGSPIERMLPVLFAPANQRVTPSVILDSFEPRLTIAGRELGIVPPLYEQDPSRVDALRFPPCYWFAATVGTKPGAEVLCEHPMERTGSEPLPLMVRGRYGSGTVLFCGLDELWRWRRGGGEWIHDAFWLNLCRILGRSSVAGADERIVISADRNRYDAGEWIPLQVEVKDLVLTESLGSDLRLLVRDADNEPVDSILATRAGPAAVIFEGTFIPPGPGNYFIDCEQVLAPPGRPRAPLIIRVTQTDVEHRRTEADHDLLKRLSQATGGLSVDLNGLRDLADRLLDRSVRIPDDFNEPLWDSKLILSLFVLIIAVEWVLRKIYGLQ